MKPVKPVQPQSATMRIGILLASLIIGVILAIFTMLAPQ
jgi:hypothetical protein